MAGGWEGRREETRGGGWGLGTGDLGLGTWDFWGDDIPGLCSAEGGVLDTSEVQERRVVTHLKPSGWLVELGCWYAWA